MGEEVEGFSDNHGGLLLNSGHQGSKAGLCKALKGLPGDKGAVRELKVELGLGHGRGLGYQEIVAPFLRPFNPPPPQEVELASNR